MSLVTLYGARHRNHSGNITREKKSRCICVGDIQICSDCPPISSQYSPPLRMQQLLTETPCYNAQGPVLCLLPGHAMVLWIVSMTKEIWSINTPVSSSHRRGISVMCFTLSHRNPHQTVPQLPTVVIY